MNLNGGYAMIKYNSTQEELQIAYKTKRPVLLYDEDKRAHWAVIEETATESVDEETQEPITIYEYSYQLLNAIEALVDDNGNQRFIEGNGTPLSQEGVTISYCKWSLSGTHLMFVSAGNVENGITLTNGSILSFYSIPQWILNKIFPVWQNAYIELKTANFYADDWTTQNVSVIFRKNNNTNRVEIGISGNLSMTANRSFRLQFDLLIDNE